MKIAFLKHELPKKGVVVFTINETLTLSPLARQLDKQTKGSITRAMQAANYKGKKGAILSILAPTGTGIDRIILLSTAGKKDPDFNNQEIFQAQEIGGKLAAYLNGERIEEATIIGGDHHKILSPEALAAHVGFGAILRCYTFQKYFTNREDIQKPSLKKLNILVGNEKQANEELNGLIALADGVYMARDLISEPPNVLNPETYPTRCKELSKLGVKVEVLNEKDMQKLGMGSLLGVGQGSERESHMVIMQWNGNPKSKEPPVAFVGKGVTFDSGGISIKPSNGMEDMKYDMAGSASVVGLMRALAGRKAKVNVVGVIGLVENMPSGSAQRPSDVVKSMSGQTIEVLNTDAEGRLVLADALWYTQNRFKPKFMVNLATLTGAITIALGAEHAGLFSNNDELSKNLLAAGIKTNEKLWRFPLSKVYDRQINSKIADMQNVGNEKGAGSITAAQFLQRFVNNYPWAHLDIAGVAWSRKNQDLLPEGATAFGVRLLNTLVADYYEAE